VNVRFLLDENLDPRLQIALRRLNPTIDVLRIGEPSAPPLGTSDPDILIFLDVAQRMLVTSNRTSMPDHLQAHWSIGKHLWGLCWVRPGFSIYRIAQELLLIWEASTAEEWLDRLGWIPL
jgi:hypothetical protein